VIDFDHFPRCLTPPRVPGTPRPHFGGEAGAAGPAASCVPARWAWPGARPRPAARPVRRSFIRIFFFFLPPGPSLALPRARSPPRVLPPP
jgi:hypothetical protein